MSPLKEMMSQKQPFMNVGNMTWDVMLIFLVVLQEGLR
jgi:hypothetical protein